MPVILITGAAAGLGEAFFNAFASDPSNEIFTLDRLPLPASRPPVNRVTHQALDVRSESDLATWYSNHLKDKPLDLVIHSAGIRGLVPDVERKHPDDVAACETMQVMDSATMMRTFEINALGTFNLLRTILPSLTLAARRNADRPPRVIVMTSRMGSIAANVAGSAYAYRASKAALNAIVKSFSIDVPDVAWILVHPGRVETKLVKCKEDGAISADASVEALMKLLPGFGKENSGKFYDRFGTEIPW